MKAEIIAVGTELLLGQIVNTNAQYLSRELANLGIDSYYQTVVGDNPARLLSAFRIASARADLVICTGGIGPTQDDLTKDVLAHFTNDRLIVHEPSLQKLKAYFQKRKVPMVESNLKQADVLAKSDVLANDVGLACGVAVKHNECRFILLPGVPREMKAMFATHAKRWILNEMGNQQTLYSKILKFSGIGESQLEHELEDLVSAQSDVTIAPYAVEGEVALRLSVKADSDQQAEEKLNITIAAVKQKVGAYLFAEEDIPLEQAALQLLMDEQLTLCAAESCTGGLLSELITAIPGSSGAFKGSLITYSNEMKMKLLGVPSELLDGEHAPGAVSKETAEAMATGAQQVTEADVALSITGVAGPDRSENKEVGLVYISLAQRGQEVETRQFQFNGNRQAIRLRAAKQALHLLVEQLGKK